MSSRNHCPMCTDFCAPTMKLLLGHIGRVHSNCPSFSFTCGLDGCLTCCKSYGALRKHIQRKHKSHESALDVQSDTSQSSVTPDPLPDSTFDSDFLAADEGQLDLDSQVKENSARWIMKFKEERKMTQRAMEEILGDVSALCTDTVTRLGGEVFEKLQSAGITAIDIPGLSDLFDNSSPYCRPFDGLDTYYRQVSFYRKHFRLIEPVQIELGRNHTWKGSGAKRRAVEKVDTFSYVPILDVLERLLQNSSILEEVRLGHRRDDDLLEDFCDAKKASEHTLFSSSASSLQLIVFFDELEVCNPLGSARKKHKLGFFYFTLGNIHPRHRSSLKCIHLLAVCKAKHLKSYGIDCVTKVIRDDISKLENGVTMETCEGQMTVLGSIATFVGDNLGSHAVGGFKEGGSALRPCRHCMVIGSDLKTQLTESNLTLRTPADHDHMCDLLSRLDHTFHTTTYGINRPCPLNELVHYHVCDYGLPPDVMHDFLEGYLPYTLKLMLSHFVSTLKLLSMDQLNSAINNFDYGYSVTSRPHSLVMDSLSLTNGCTTFPLSAAETWTFGRLLPVMIGNYVPEDNVHWAHYLELLDILDLVCAPIVHKNSPALLQVLIESNLSTFTTLYPDASFIPKMHYLLHLPRYIENVGPMVRHWTMRFEAKHQYFKRLVASMGNFINLAHSLAYRHQCYQCYVLQDDDVLQDKIECGPGKSIPLVASEYKEELSHVSPCSSLFRANWVKVNGVLIKIGAVVVVKTYMEETESPQFAQVTEIFALPTKKVLLGMKLLEVTSYSTHFHSWTVMQTDRKYVADYKELHSSQMLHARCSSFSLSIVKFVTMKFSVF